LSFLSCKSQVAAKIMATIPAALIANTLNAYHIQSIAYIIQIQA
jgi:hypothetical protein